MEFLRFIFSSFWVWLGFLVLIGTVCAGVADVVKSCKRNRKVTGYRIGERWHIEIENATAADVQQAIVSAAYAPGSGDDGNTGEDGNGAER